MKSFTTTVFAALLFIAQNSNAQNVGIGTTTPDASAQLHILSSNKGLLIPQVSLVNITSAAPITSPAYGLLVFNTNGGMTGGTVGYYYWNAVSWQLLQTQTTGWGTYGNSFATGYNPLLGTISPTPLNFIVSNNKAGLIDSFNTHIGYKAGGQHTTAKNTVAIGNAALFINSAKGGLVAVGDSALYRNGAGAFGESEAIDNTAVGFKSLKENMTGSGNTAVGNNTLTELFNANYNTAIGAGALFLSKTENNTAVGYQALYNNSNDPTGSTATRNNAFGVEALYNNRSGAANIAIGDMALLNNRSGSYNVALGTFTGSLNGTGDRNVFIGYRAGEFARSSNKLYIESSNADSANALIYGDFAADSLQLNAKVIVRDRLQVNDAVHIADSNVVAYASGTLPGSPAAPPVSGAGRRMMWYVDKGAFRAGNVNGTQWDAANVGVYSTAFGRNSIASGGGSFAAGIGARALQDGAVAMGNVSSAFGAYSTAIGEEAIAAGAISTSVGYQTSAIGNYSTAIGVGGQAIGETSFSYGDSSIARGTFSTALGRGTIAQSWGSTTVGLFNDTSAFETPGSWNPYERLFVVGNGNAETFRSSALVILKNGNTDISGYTRLGTLADGAPRIKTKKITIPSGPAINTFQSYALGSGITDAKVLGVQVTLNYAGTWKMPPGYIDAPGYEYNIQIQNNNLVVILKNGNSANIGSKPITALITYEE